MGNFFIRSVYFISSRFGVTCISYRSHSWMTLIGSDQLAELAYTVYSKVKFLFKCMNSNKMLCLALMVLHIIQGVRETD